MFCSLFSVLCSRPAAQAQVDVRLSCKQQGASSKLASGPSDGSVPSRHRRTRKSNQSHQLRVPGSSPGPATSATEQRAGNKEQRRDDTQLLLFSVPCSLFSIRRDSLIGRRYAAQPPEQLARDHPTLWAGRPIGGHRLGMAKIRGQRPAGPPPSYTAVAQLDERARPKRQAARSSRAGGASERGSANGRPRRFERRYRGSNPCPRTRKYNGGLEGAAPSNSPLYAAVA